MINFFNLAPFASTAAILVSAPAAYALNADEFLTTFQHGLSIPENSMTIGTARLQGDDIVFEGVTVTTQTEDGQDYAFPIGTLTFTGIEETDTGYMVQSATMDGFVMASETATASIGAVRADNLFFPFDLFAEGQIPFVQYDSVIGANTTLSTNGEPLVTMDGFEMVTDRSNLPEFTGTAKINNVSISLPSSTSPETVQMLQSLGMEDITFDVTANSFWNLETGDIAFSDMTYDMVNVGALSVDFSAGGYTQDVHQKNIVASRSVMENGPSADPMAQMAQLELLQDMTLQNMQISFADDGITKRALDVFGKQQGTNGEQMALLLPMMVGMGLGNLNLPDALKAQITGSLTTYLGDPQNITISAMPVQPVSFLQLFAIGSTDPAALPDLVNLSVAANE